MPDKLGDRSLIRPGVVLTCTGSGSQSSAWITSARRHVSVTVPSVSPGRAVGSTRDPPKSLARPRSGHSRRQAISEPTSVAPVAQPRDLHSKNSWEEQCQSRSMTHCQP